MLSMLLSLAALAGPPIDAQPIAGEGPALRYLDTHMRLAPAYEVLVTYYDHRGSSHPLHPVPERTASLSGTLVLEAFDRVPWTDSVVHMHRPQRYHALQAWTFDGQRWDPEAHAEGDRVKVEFEAGDTLLWYLHRAEGEQHPCWIGWQSAEGPGFGFGECPPLSQDRWEQVRRTAPGDARDDREWWVFVPAEAAPPEGGWLYLNERYFNAEEDRPHDIH